jgi:hypothetical protein
MLAALAQKEEAQPSLGARLRAWVSTLLEGPAARGVDVQRLLRSAAVAAAVVVLIAIGTVAVGSWRRTMVGQEAVLRPEDGLVEVLPSGADTWLPLSEDMVVRAGDRIRTGAEGSAELVFFDGSITALRPEAELTIGQMASQRTGTGKVIVLHQWFGEAYNQVQPLVDEGSRFRVETASAVVSVRGTAFTLTVEADGRTRLEVHEGAIEVQTRETSVVVRGGEEIQVQSPRPSATPVPVTTPEPADTPVSPSSTEPSVSPPSTGPPWSLWWVETPQLPEWDEVQPTQEIGTPQPPEGETEESPSPKEPEDEDDEQPKKTPPGHTKTPEPPGQTRTPEPPGQDKDPKPDNNRGKPPKKK